MKTESGLIFNNIYGYANLNTRNKRENKRILLTKLL